MNKTVQLGEATKPPARGEPGAGRLCRSGARTLPTTAAPSLLCHDECSIQAKLRNLRLRAISAVLFHWFVPASASQGPCRRGAPSFSLQTHALRTKQRELLLFLGTPEPSQPTVPPLKVFKFSPPPRLHRGEVCPAIAILKAVAPVFGFTLALVFREQPKMSQRTDHYWAGGLVGEREPEASPSASLRESPAPEALSWLGWDPGISQRSRTETQGAERRDTGRRHPLLDYPLHQTSLHLSHGNASGISTPPEEEAGGTKRRLLNPRLEGTLPSVAEDRDCALEIEPLPGPTVGNHFSNQRWFRKGENHPSHGCKGAEQTQEEHGRCQTKAEKRTGDISPDSIVGKEGPEMFLR